MTAALGRPPRPGGGRPPLPSTDKAAASGGYGAAAAANAVAIAKGERRPNMTGWLLKKKRRTGRFFRGTNKRFFTIDFEGQIFYYAHSASGKQVSRPTAFRSIEAVSPFVQGGDKEEKECMIYCAPPSDDEGGAKSVGDDDWDGKDTSDEDEEPQSPSKRSVSKQSVGSKASTFSTLSSRFRIPSFSSFRKGKEQHGVRILLKSGEEEQLMELIATSKEDADRWNNAFSEALALGQAASGGPPRGSKFKGDAGEDSTEDGSAHGDRSGSGTGSPTGSGSGRLEEEREAAARAAEQDYDSDSS